LRRRITAAAYCPAPAITITTSTSVTKQIKLKDVIKPNHWVEPSPRSYLAGELAAAAASLLLKDSNADLSAPTAF
jgi:hypothetical protein